MPKQPSPSAEISSIHHADRRANIPTEELRDFVADDEQAPPMLRYPRDPSLDPQLVWRGKDEQDAEDLAVPVVPIYIQEKIHPQAIINDLLAQAARPGSMLRDAATAYQLNMFADFNGGPEEFDEKVEFYQHEQNWTNRLILGDSLLVMASLAEKEGLRGKVQTIYIDPPYGIKFGSNWQVSTRKRDVKDGRAEDATRQPEQVRAFRDTWKLGIHSYLAYLRDRLTVARDLLTETGSVFVQIGDENVHLVRSVLDEVFGSENAVSVIPFIKTSGAGSPAIGTKVLASVADYLVWYCKNKDQVKYRQIYVDKLFGEVGASQYVWIESPSGTSERPMTDAELADPSQIPDDWRVFAHDNFTSQSGAETTQIPVDFNGKRYVPTKGGWKTNAMGIQRLLAASRFMSIGDTLRYKRRLVDFAATPINNIWLGFRTSGFADPKRYVVQTNPGVVERCLLMTSDPGDLVLDPTCGSGTTAYVAEQWGRRWITCDTSRVALALARTRLMAARYPYYLLADSAEGAKKEMELRSNDFGRSNFATTKVVTTGMGDIRKGFVYKRVPHVTLKSIANNAEIDAIHAEFQPELDRWRAEINRLANRQWQDWEVPRQLPGDLSGLTELSGLIDGWWQLYRERQRQIDASIARHADTETLYDQPYEDNKRVRVCGPFSVESLSPHRVLAADDDGDVVVSGREAAQHQDFAAMILDNLKKAGVQNTRKGERLTFDRLDPYAGTWLHAAGEYTESGQSVGQSSGLPYLRRVAVSIGPEHGTVGPQQVKEAAKEAVQGVGFDLLVICGFAFDPHVSEEVKRYGKLTVLPAKMNPDLAMGDELLKKTGAGNLFMVFGEPDVEIRPARGIDRSNDFGRSTTEASTEVATTDAANKIVVEIKGVDVYDPTTGQIRSASTDDIACWFIDTDYNGESFFVRHAYFTGADEPYEKLKRALRAEIDESAWSSLYRTTSRPFTPPASGKIAVKVINHYGDEVLKVFTV